MAGYLKKAANFRQLFSRHGICRHPFRFCSYDFGLEKISDVTFATWNSTVSRSHLPVCGNQVKAFAGQPCSGSDHVHEFLLCQYLNTELLRLCQLASGLFPADQVICLFGDGAAGRGTEADDFGVDPVAGEVLKFPCGYDGASDTLGAFLL